MKKKLAIIGTIALLGVGGVTVFSLNNPSWRETQSLRRQETSKLHG